MGDRNETNIDLNRPAASETFELLLLHSPQEFWLHFQADVADLIQK